MKDFLFQLSELKSQNRIFTLCIIVGAKGSTPRKEGAKMLVFDDGTIFGTIGGGAIELQVIADALEVLRSGKPVKKMYQLEEDVQMHCGGSMEIYMEPFNKDLNLYIFGAGHVAGSGSLCADLDFKVSMWTTAKGIPRVPVRLPHASQRLL